MDLFSADEMPVYAPDRAARLGDVLIVDDSRTNLQVMGRRLSHMGYAVTLSTNGIEGLDLMQARRFDLVLLDMVMPGMSGVAVLRELRGTPGISDLPVLMVTARSDASAVVEAMSAGADDHIAKPFDFDVLGARMTRLLERARMLNDLRRSNAALDARIAHRAMEMGELRQELEDIRDDRDNLLKSFRELEAKMSGATA